MRWYINNRNVFFWRLEVHHQGASKVKSLFQLQTCIMKGRAEASPLETLGGELTNPTRESTPLSPPKDLSS